MASIMEDDRKREFSFSKEEFGFLASFANKQTGIVLTEQKKDMVYSRLVRRLRILGLKSFAEYCNLLQSENGKDEISNLVNAITTNLTSFFRETDKQSIHDGSSWKTIRRLSKPRGRTNMADGEA